MDCTKTWSWVVGLTSLLGIPLGYAVTVIWLEVHFIKDDRAAILLLWVLGTALPYGIAKLADWFRSNVDRWTEDAHHKKIELLQELKHDLPLRLAGPLLQRFDPEGRHELIVEDPRTAESLRTVQREEQQLIWCINMLAERMQQHVGVEAAREVFASVAPALAPFASRLPTVQALRGATMGAQALRFVAGAAVGDGEIDRGTRRQAPATVAGVRGERGGGGGGGGV